MAGDSDCLNNLLKMLWEKALGKKTLVSVQNTSLHHLLEMKTELV